MKEQLKQAGLIGDFDQMRSIGSKILLGRGTETEKAQKFLAACEAAGSGVQLAMADYALRHVRDNLPMRKRPIFGDGAADPDRDDFPAPPCPRPVPKPDAVPPGSGVVVSIYDRVTIRGRPIGEIRYCDIDGLVATNAYETAILARIKKQYTPANIDDTIRDIVSANWLAQVVKEAENKRKR